MSDLKLIGVFLATLALCATVAWLSGYDFNDRNLWVAGYALTSLIVATIVTGWCSFDTPDNVEVQRRTRL